MRSDWQWLGRRGAGGGRRAALGAALIGLLATAVGAQAPASLSDSAFGRLSAALSEPAGFFDTDNLISNEDSYLHVYGTLKRVGVTGGAYLGVGPDQNFSYIAAVRPHVAFMIDIRRDNLLQHLLLKSMFALSRNRIEYLCMLFGERPPADTTGWGARPVEELLAYVDSVRTDAATAGRIRASVLDRVARLGIALSPVDLGTIARFHNTFIAAGPALKFNSTGRAPAAYYPDFRRLLVETDLTGRQSSYLAHESDFQVVKSLEDRNLVVPVVGNLAGTKALAAIGQWMRDNRETVSVFYTSNVEQYLFGDGSFSQFARTASALPRTAQSVFVRSFFQGGHPQAVAGYHATQVTQFIEPFAGRSFGSYMALLTSNVIPP